MKDKYKSKPNQLEALSSTGESKKLSQETSRPNSFDKPTPLDFDAFVPWICLEWQSPEIVVVTRLFQEEYVKCDRRSSTRSKSTRSLKFKQEDLESMEPKRSAVTSIHSRTTEFMNSIADSFVPIKAYYDNRGHLVEISITDCLVEIHRKVIQAINICIPFHSLLTKLTIRRGGVTNSLLHEIGTMLPHSNLTDICLDDCIVPEGNYNVIIEQASQLKYLSLNRCGITNEVCCTLAKKIVFGGPGSTLLILELGSNSISDRGAKELGQSLRGNRRLLHLNLSGNKITDAGASSMLAHLVEFKLTWDEIVDARHRKLKYTEKKREVYASCYEDVLKRQKAELLAGSSTVRNISKNKSTRKGKEDSRKQKKSPPSSIFLEEKSAVDIAEAMTLEIVGKFDDPYEENSVVQKNEYSHSKGNMVLCSLNLAYNNLSFISIKRIYEVLKYQERIVKPNGATGLMRVVFDGNFIPAHCVEYDRIEMFLKKAVNDNTPTVALNAFHKKRITSVPSSRKS